MNVSGLLQAQTALPQGLSGDTADKDIVVKRRIPVSSRNRTLVVQPIDSNFTN